MRIRCCGAAGQVTGSGYLIETDAARVLVDFGLFAGEADAERRNATIAPVEPGRLDAVLVTHAHLDHTGRLPLLAKLGYAGPIHATLATVDVGALLLEDSARIEEADTERANRERRRLRQPLLEPLATIDDARLASKLMRPVPYDREVRVADGMVARWFEAGHILGSASIELTVRTGAGERRIVFSGDVGPRGSPILRDPVKPERGDLVFLESTYGDRDHPSREATRKAFVEALRTAIWSRRKVIIPAFAVGRTQSILYMLAQATAAGELPEFPIYLDSPMASKVTEAYRHHQELYDAEALAATRERGGAPALRLLRIVETVQESKALNESRESCLVIAGSGMCEGGRVVHHLRHSLGRSDVTVIMVGYMAEGTLGRRLLDGERSVHVLGDEVAVRATIQSIAGLSAHAGRSELLDWLSAVAPQRPRVILTHGEEPQRAALKAGIEERYGLSVRCPLIGEPIALD